MINYTHLWFVPARKASLISHKTKPQFIRPFEDIKSPNSLKITKQQLPKLNYQCNHGIPSHNNISNASTTIKPFDDVPNFTHEILVPDNNASNNFISQISNSTCPIYNPNIYLHNNHLQATAMDLTKSISFVFNVPEVTPVKQQKVLHMSAIDIHFVKLIIYIFFL